MYGYIHLQASCPVAAKTALATLHEPLTGWDRLVKAGEREPVPEAFVYYVAGWMLRNGRLMSAAATLVQFDVYGRPRETLELTSADVLLAGSGRGSVVPHLSVVVFGNSETDATTKNNIVDGHVCVGVAPRPWIADVLRQLVRITSAPTTIFGNLTVSRYAEDLRAAVSALNLQELALTPHVLRHTGPSNDALHHRRCLEEIQVRGRWLSVRSVHRYEKHARLLRQARRVSSTQCVLAAAAQLSVPAALLAALRHAPKAPV